MTALEAKLLRVLVAFWMFLLIGCASFSPLSPGAPGPGCPRPAPEWPRP